MAISAIRAYWSLDEASGTRNDSVGSNHLTDNNTVLSATGKVSTAADFEMDNTESLSCTDNAATSVSDADYTFIAWIKSETLSSDRSILGKGGSNDLPYNLDTNGAAARLRVSSGAGFANLTSVSAGPLSTGTWYLIVAAHDSVNNLIKLSIDGGAWTDAAYSAGMYNDTGDFNIGAFPFYGNNYDGLIDEVGIFDGVASSDDLTFAYNSGSGRSYSDWVTRLGGGSTFTMPVIVHSQAVNRAAFY